LHNADEVARKGVLIGDMVVLRKAGDVYPRCRAGRRPADRDRAGVRVPLGVPGLRTTLARDEGEVDWRCPNARSCPAQLRERLFTLAGRGALDIEVLGYEAVAACWRRAWSQRGDIFGLTADSLAAARSSWSSRHAERERDQAAAQPGGGAQPAALADPVRCRSGMSGRPRPRARHRVRLRRRDRGATAEQLTAPMMSARRSPPR